MKYLYNQFPTKQDKQAIIDSKDARDMITYLGVFGFDQEIEDALLISKDKHRICHAFKYFGGPNVAEYETRLVELDAFFELLNFDRPYEQLRGKFNDDVHKDGYKINRQTFIDYVDEKFCGETRVEFYTQDNKFTNVVLALKMFDL